MKTWDSLLHPLLLAMIGYSIIYTDTIHDAILFIYTSTILDTRKLIL